jgi:hypothetical protein
MATKGTKGAKSDSVGHPQNELLKLNARRSKINEHAVLDAGCTEVATDLGRVLIHECAHRFEFHDEFSIDAQVSEEIPKEASVVIMHRNRHLLFHREPFFAEPVAEGIFVNLLIVSVTEEAVSFECRLTNGIG